MTIERRQNYTKFWNYVYVRLEGKKIYLGIFEDSPYGLHMAKESERVAKDIIRQMKIDEKELDPWVATERREDLYINLKDMVARRVAQENDPKVVGAPSETPPRWDKYKVKETEVARCPGCGHNFYDDAPVRDGLCKWCVQEQDGTLNK